MAKQDVKTSDQQSKQATETAQSAHPAGIARRASSSLPATLTTPFDFFFMNPFSVMRRMAEEMDRAFGAGAAAGEDVLWSPAIEVSEGEGQYKIRAELAGLKPDDVTLEIEDGALTLQGERKSQ